MPCPCSDLLRDPKAWNVLATFVTAALLVTSTALLVQTCYVPDNDQTAAECAAHDYTLLAEQWVAVVILAVAAFALILMYHVIRCSGFCCFDQCCNNNRHTLILSIICAASATVYANYLHKKLETVPESPISQPNACLVCPDGRSKNLTALLYTGVAVGWCGSVVTAIVLYMRYVQEATTSSKASYLQEALQENEARDKAAVDAIPD